MNPMVPLLKGHMVSTASSRCYITLSWLAHLEDGHAKLAHLHPSLVVCIATFQQ